MTYNKKTIEDISVKGKKVIARCDFNVPMKDGVITDDKRIVGAIPTIKYLIENGAAVILCSHLGRPHNVFNEKLKLDKKEKKKIDELPEAERAAATEAALKKAAGDVKKLSLAPVATRISELLGKPVIMAKDVIGPDATSKAAALKSGEVMLLENVRFHEEEEKNGNKAGAAGEKAAKARPQALSKGTKAFLKTIQPLVTTHFTQAGIGHMSEVFSATEPYTAGGTIAQAWSEAEVYRALVNLRAADRETFESWEKGLKVFAQKKA